MEVLAGFFDSGLSDEGSANPLSVPEKYFICTMVTLHAPTCLLWDACLLAPWKLVSCSIDSITVLRGVTVDRVGVGESSWVRLRALLAKQASISVADVEWIVLRAKSGIVQHPYLLRSAAMGRVMELRVYFDAATLIRQGKHISMMSLLHRLQTAPRIYLNDASPLYAAIHSTLLLRAVSVSKGNATWRVLSTDVLQMHVIGKDIRSDELQMHAVTYSKDILDSDQYVRSLTTACDTQFICKIDFAAILLSVFAATPALISQADRMWCIS